MDSQSGKLAVILHADIADSTRLVQHDEHLAHERFQQSFNRFRDRIISYHGHVLELRGDALVAEFERVSDAVSASLSFQHDQADFVAHIDDDIRPRIRVGIALGEVVIADNTVTGAGVVLAQRVEQLAQAGGVCISSAVHEALPKRMPLNLENLGDHELKGFDDPVRIYRVSSKAGAPLPPPQASGRSGRPQLMWKLSGLSIAAAVAILGGIFYLAYTGDLAEEPALETRMEFQLPDKPSIAVLPFTNMSDDPDQDYFVDGITEDLITDISKIPELFVIARNSVFSYRGKSIKVRQVAEELGVRYILEGSVRRSGDQVRINAQLIDATTGGHLWADRYDGQLSDVFGLQDKVTSKIVTVLSVKLTASDRQRFARRQTSDARAYDEFLKGWNSFIHVTPENILQAISHFEKAIQLDPQYSRAYAALAATYWQGWRRSWHRQMGYQRWHNLRTRAEEYLDKALQDPTPLAHQVAAEMHLQDRRHEEGLAEVERAIAQDPNDADSYITLAAILSLSGRHDEAISSTELAMRLNPRYPSVYLYTLGLAYFGMERFGEAVLSLEKAVALNPQDRWSKILLLAAYGQLNRVDEAARVLDSLESPHFLDLASIRSISYWYPYKTPEDAARFTDGLRKAGVPD